VVFQADCDEIDIKKSVMTSLCDIIAIASAKWRHQTNVTKFFYFAPPQSNFLATPVLYTSVCYTKRLFKYERFE